MSFFTSVAEIDQKLADLPLVDGATQSKVAARQSQLVFAGIGVYGIAPYSPTICQSARATWINPANRSIITQLDNI